MAKLQVVLVLMLWPLLCSAMRFKYPRFRSKDKRRSREVLIRSFDGENFEIEPAPRSRKSAKRPLRNVLLQQDEEQNIEIQDTEARDPLSSIQEYPSSSINSAPVNRERREPAAAAASKEQPELMKPVPASATAAAAPKANPRAQVEKKKTPGLTTDQPDLAHYWHHIVVKRVLGLSVQQVMNNAIEVILNNRDEMCKTRQMWPRGVPDMLKPIGNECALRLCDTAKQQQQQQQQRGIRG